MNQGRLVLLHRYNGWNLLFLVVSGIILYLPELRGPLAAVRTPLKYLHIGSGILSLALLAAYIPFFPDHWRRLGARVGQKVNIGILVALLLGWGATGILLWFNRYMPPGVAESALIWHDRLTWWAIPWASLHALTRYYKIRLLQVRAPMEGRRLFVAGALTMVGALAWGGLARRLSLPGFEGDTTPASEGLIAAGHEPVQGNSFQPVPISPAPAEGGRKGRFRIYSVINRIPTFPMADWRFTVTGLVDKPVTLAWEELLSLPRAVQVSDFHCVTGWSVYNVKWEGVRVTHLLELAGVKPEASHINFISGDGQYDSAVPLEVVRMDDVMLPFLIDGAPLPGPLGGPLRLVIPQMYAYKSVKWVERMDLLSRPYDGYWEQRGYPSDAWLQKRQAKDDWRDLATK